MKKTLIVGLTGQTGAGKSAVSDFLTKWGFRVIDADIVSRRVVEKGKKCLVDLVIAFGTEILEADGSLNRKKLGAIVFHDRQKRIHLQEIIFPYIQEEIAAELETHRNSGEPAVFLDAPTLLESDSKEQCDKIVSVIAPSEERFIRILRRDGLSAEEAQRRMGAQHEDEFYTSQSDFVINNAGDLVELRVQIMEMLDYLGLTLSPDKGTIQ